MRKFRFSNIWSEFFQLKIGFKRFFRPSEIEFCEKFTKQEVCFNEDEFSDCQCPQSIKFQKVYFLLRNIFRTQLLRSYLVRKIYENIQYRLLAFIIMFVLPTFIITISYISLIRNVNLNLFRSRSNLIRS